MVEYFLTLSLLHGFHFPALLDRLGGVLKDPLVLVGAVVLAMLLLRTRVK
jgi:hypothetical protein